MWQKYRRIIVYFLVGAGILLLVNFLYDRDIQPVLYSLEIMLFLGLCVAGYDFYRCRKKKEQLMLIKNRLPEELKEFPQSKDDIEILYQDMMIQLFEQLQDENLQYKEQIQNQSEYYTMWIHQIKTPIAAMRLLLKNADLNLYRMAITRELFHIEQYAEMAMHYLHLMNQEEDLLLTEHELSDIVKQVLKKYSLLFIEKKLNLDLQEFSYRCITDEKWLSFVIEQVLSNAIKYTRKGTIRIRFQNEKEPTLLIEDTGIGIRKEDIPRIFDKGFTGYNGHIDKRATGIGLYLSKCVVDKLGMKISVSSKINEGTKVCLMMRQDNQKDSE